jgi:Holliday junction resolvase RusA-like endonuclease
MTFVFSDLVAVTNCALPELSFVVKGRPPVQQRPKIVWKTRAAPVYYDPSAREKRLWRLLLKRELIDCGVNLQHPFFPNETQQSSKGIFLNVVFFFARPSRDFRTKNGIRVLKDVHQKYPGSKDTDNMVKFIMDAMHIVIYNDDKCVARLLAEKRFVDENDASNKPYTQIRMTKIV